MATPEARCERSDLPESMCAHCRGHIDEVPVDEQLTVDDIGPRFTAQYATPCNAGCGGDIEPGETIAALNDRFGYACPGCLP